MSAAAPLAAPPVVPGYTLELLLGRGGSGEVWRAVPRGGGPPVAVKVLIAGDPERQAREAALLGELDHPHLVRLHDVVHQPSRGGVPRVALVLDLLPGGSLASLLARRGRLRAGEVVTAISPVAAALAHAHGAGVVHGDLSPGNIVFTAEGRPVLTDLGVARVLGDAACGEVTPAYVDPTVARGGAPGPASDVFGIAAAAFHALTGVAPWNAAGPADTLAVAAAGELPDLDELAPDAPAELRAVIARGLSADPADRGSAAAFALDLRSACRPEPVRLPRTGVPDDELDGTGLGPRAELTHQVRRAAAVAAVPGPRAAPGTRLVERMRRLTPSGVAARRGALLVTVLVTLLVVLGSVVWAGGRWGSGSAAEPAPAAARTTAVPSSTGASSTGASSTAAASTAAPTAPGGAPAVPPSSRAAAVALADRQEVPSSAGAWQALVTELYDRRAHAFATAAAAALTEVYAADSPALRADEQALDALIAQHLTVQGFRPRVERVVAVTIAGQTAELRLVDSWTAYQVAATGDASAPSSAPARPEQPVRMTLRRTAVGWRIATVARET